MACTSCKKKKGKGIGSLSPADKKEMEEWGIMAAGAFVAKLLVNPLAKAIYKKDDPDPAKRKAVPTQFPMWVKAAASVGLWMYDEDWSKTAAKGVATVAAIEALEYWQPDIFKNAFVAKGNVAPANPNLPAGEAAPAANHGIHGSVILDLDNIEGLGIGYMSNSSRAENEMGRGAMW